MEGKQIKSKKKNQMHHFVTHNIYYRKKLLDISPNIINI